jgi:hypothetical protein
MPEDISEKTKQHANTLMESEIEKFSVSIVADHYRGKDAGRKHELTTAVRISLNRIANRIDRGFNFEVRIEPLAGGKDIDKAKAEAVEKAVETIESASLNMQYMKLEGPPILALPEKAGQDKDNADGKHKKKSKATEAQPSPEGSKSTTKEDN